MKGRGGLTFVVIAGLAAGHAGAALAQGQRLDTARIEEIYQVEDATFPDAGKVGKADSVIRFDDLRIVAH